MKILITNDDGIFAEGIYALAQSLKKVGDITVVAPDTQRSAVGHAITLTDPLRVEKVNRNKEFFGYAASGTPADCVKLGIKAIMNELPDIVVSGINLGENAGYNVLYSGTVSGATEGALLGIPSLAVSLDTFVNPDFSAAADYAAKMVKIMLEKSIPKGTLINVNVPNVPAAQIKGSRVATQSKTLFNDWFEKRIDPHGKTYYWMTGNFTAKDNDELSDVNALKQNFISVTPLHFDLTDRSFIKEVEKWNLQ